MPEKETCEFNFTWTFQNLNFQVGVGYFQHTPNQACHTQNEKLDLCILQHLEQLLRLGLGWVISAYPQTMNIASKNENLDLGILQHLEQLLGLGLGWVISAYPQP